MDDYDYDYDNSEHGPYRPLHPHREVVTMLLAVTMVSALAWWALWSLWKLL